MRKAIYSAIVVLTFLPLVSCMPQPSKKMLPLEIQAIQKRDFETTKKIAFGSVVSVLQDVGYIIGSADFNTGFITGNSPTQDSPSAQFWLGISINTTTKVSAFVEELTKGRVSIRLNFVTNETTSSSYGQTSISDQPILDEKVYIEAFNKIENAIFIRS